MVSINVRFLRFVKWLWGILESHLCLCCPCVRGAAGAAEVCAELHCCSAERLSLWAAMHGLLWPCPLVVPPQGMGGTVVAWPRAFSPLVVARFQSASLQVCWRWESYKKVSVQILLRREGRGSRGLAAG